MKQPVHALILRDEEDALWQLLQCENDCFLDSIVKWMRRTVRRSRRDGARLSVDPSRAPDGMKSFGRASAPCPQLLVEVSRWSARSRKIHPHRFLPPSQGYDNRGLLRLLDCFKAGLPHCIGSDVLFLVLA